MSYTIVIPARYGSSRFPGKPLADIAGKTMIERVYLQCQQAKASQIVVATDDTRIQQVVEGFGGQVCMTSDQHESGTERIAEVIEKLGLSDDEIIVNVQGDEPFIPPAVVDQVAANLAGQSLANMSTLAVNIDDVEEALNPNAVKVVTDKDGYALYFSRSTIPYDRSRMLGTSQITDLADCYLRHIGIYAYRASFVARYIQWQPTQLEAIEALEQLRVLWYGEKIHVDVATQEPPAGIDTPEDLENAIARLQSDS